MQYLVIWYPIENPLHFYNSCSLNLRKTCSKTLSKHDFILNWNSFSLRYLTHWGRVTHICVSKLTITGLDNGLSPEHRQAMIWTNDGILLIGTLGTNFSEILSEIHTLSFMKMHLKTSSAKRRPFCLGLNVLITKYCTLDHAYLPFSFSAQVVIRRTVAGAMPVRNYLVHTKFSYIHIVMIGTLEVVAILGEYQKMKNPCTFYCVSLISDIASCIFSSITRHMSIEISIFVYGWYRAISSKSKCQIRVYALYFPNNTYFFAIV